MRAGQVQQIGGFVETGRRRLVGWSGALTAAGLLLMLSAGVRAARYLPGWGESLPTCLRDGGCTEASAQATLRTLWGLVASGASVVLIGVVLAAVLLPAVVTGTARRRMGPAGHALLAGAAGFVTAAVLALAGLVAAFFSEQAAVAVLCALWVGQAVVLAALDRAVGVLSPRAGWLTGLVVSGLAVATALGDLLTRQSNSVNRFAVLDGAALVAVVLAVRVATVWAGGPGTGTRPWFPGSRPLAAVLTMGTVLIAVLLVLLPEQSSVPAGRPVTTYAPPPPPIAPAPPPSPAPTTAPAPVTAAEPCAAEDVSFAVAGFDGAMGARAASLQATNISTGPCWVEGAPVVVLLQGGRPMALTVDPGQTPDGAPAVAQRVGLAPGGAAYALLTWRSYGGWADTETPQSVTAALDATTSLASVDMTDAPGAAPFDIADGGAWAIAPWAPPWN
jgi:hypothetical protein